MSSTRRLHLVHLGDLRRGHVHLELPEERFLGRTLRDKICAKAQHSNANRSFLHALTLSLRHAFSSAQPESPKPQSCCARQPLRLTLRFPEFCGKPCGKGRHVLLTSSDFSNLHCLHIVRSSLKPLGISHLQDKYCMK